jgi:hypothetical protein
MISPKEHNIQLTIPREIEIYELPHEEFKLFKGKLASCKTISKENYKNNHTNRITCSIANKSQKRNKI